jgi:hypothetical protein
MSQPKQKHPKGPTSPVGRLVEKLMRVQVLLAHGDLAGVWQDRRRRHPPRFEPALRKGRP